MKPNYNKQNVNLVLKAIALIPVFIQICDELEKSKILWRQKVKQHGSLFRTSIMTEYANFYKGFPDELQKQHFKDVNRIESAIEKINLYGKDEFKEELMELCKDARLNKERTQKFIEFYNKISC